MAYSVGGKLFQNISDAQRELDGIKRARFAAGEPMWGDRIEIVPDTAAWAAPGGVYGFNPSSGGASGGAASGGVTGGASGNRFDPMLSDAEGRLKKLLDDPNSIQQSAGYQFRVNQGQEALQRSLGAKGMLASGNRLMDLTKYGQDMASQEYDNQFGRLKDLLGTGTTGYIGDRSASNQAQDISNRFALGTESNAINRTQVQQNKPATTTNPWMLANYLPGYQFG